MPALSVVKYGLFAIHDTGAPLGVETYPTLILLHGYTWHSGVFSRLIPFAAKHHVRLVLVNRRDYPGTTPYAGNERKLLDAGATQTPQGAEALRTFLKGCGKDLYHFLEEYIAKEKVPQMDQGGGIILAAWSYATVFVTALLANARTYTQGEINVASYLRYAVNYDPPYHALGYPPLENGYNPLIDPALPSDERPKRFALWVSGYFQHGESPSELEPRTPLTSPPPTMQVMTPEDIESALFPGPGNPEGSDSIILNAGIGHGTHNESRLAAYFPPETSTSDWDIVKLRHVWCDQSVWETPWAKFCLEAEFEKAKKVGKKFRPYEFVKMRHANHFIHWDQPERSLLVLLGDDEAAETA